MLDFLQDAGGYLFILIMLIWIVALVPPIIEAIIINLWGNDNGA